MRTTERLARLILSASLLALAQGLASATVAPDPSAPVVAQLVTRLIEDTHYSHRPVDETVSRQMLRNYIEFFDYNRMLLEKSDVDEFEARYGDTLNNRLKAGDVAPAYAIFDRVEKRLAERTALVHKLTASTFTFKTDETYAVDRTKSPWPAAGPERDDLWKRRVEFELLQEKLNGAKPEDQVKTVNGRYDRLLRTFQEYDSSSVLQAYLSALTHAFDPHSDYMAAAQTENFNISMRLSLQGIGAVLNSEEGYAKIVSLVPGGPADMDHRLKPNDKIEAVAQGEEPFVETVSMPLDRVVQLIRGPKGTTVRLKVIPADAIDRGTRVVIKLVRDEIKLTEQEAKARVLTVPGRPDPGPGHAGAGGAHAPLRIGLLSLPSFYADMKGGVGAKSTAIDVERLLARLKKERIEGLILDLRRNGGGSLKEAIALTGLFIAYGPVVQVKDTGGRMSVLDDTDPGVAYDGPMVVLTSKGSASASEITAAALQDYGRAVIIGEKSTFGKGTVQAMIDLARYMPSELRDAKPGSLKLTIQKFYRVSGGSTQNRGVIPDVRLPALSDEADFAESSQKNAMPYDEVPAVAVRRIDQVTAVLPRLEQESARRVAASREFAWVRDDVRLWKEQKDKPVSLNEAKRLEEKKEQEAREKERNKARLAVKDKPFEEGPEITIEELDGKPAPKPIPPPVDAKAPDAKPSDAKASGAMAPDTKPPDKSGKGEKDYEKAPPAPDLFLQEGTAVLIDFVEAQHPRAAQAAHAANP